MKTVTEKTCPMCKSLKPSSEFYKNHRDGLSPYCKPCSAKRKRKGEKTREEISRLVYPSDLTKVCSKCGKEKCLTEFNSRIRESGNVHSKPYCKVCQGEMFRSWAIKNGRIKSSGRDEMLSNIKAIRYPSENMKLCSTCNTIKTREEFGYRFSVGGSCKACRSEQEKLRYKKNNDARREYAKNYRNNNLEAVREMARKGAKVRSQRLNEARAHGKVSQSEKFELVAKFGYSCMCCGRTESITFDHIVPISAGGLDRIDNIQLLCVSCNSSKGSKVIDYRPKEEIAA